MKTLEKQMREDLINEVLKIIDTWNNKAMPKSIFEIINKIEKLR